MTSAPIPFTISWQDPPSEPIDAPFTGFLSPGVYVLRDAKGRVLYVGQSADVRGRLADHRRLKKWFRDVRTRTVYLLDDASARLLTETCLIFRHRPRHNRAIKLCLCQDGSLKELQFLRGGT